ncbi:hypothetical protein BDV59DRAFT_192416 [Aspergillus ambiguus]|uniref:uncharacterized protein n=1 Tax=Aspergillus ambiguus TaxID=176160 RepID=UPI003CCC93B3
MDCPSENFPWGNSECWYRTNNSVPTNIVNPSSVSDLLLSDLALFEPYQTGLFGSNATSTDIGGIKPNVDALHTLIPGSTEGAEANYHPLPPYGTVGRGLDSSMGISGTLIDITPVHRGRTRARARRSRRKSINPDTMALGRKAELMRHIESKHIEPRAHKCPGCTSTFNRKDNL